MPPKRKREGKDAEEKGKPVKKEKKSVSLAPSSSPSSSSSSSSSSTSSSSSSLAPPPSVPSAVPSSSASSASAPSPPISAPSLATLATMTELEEEAKENKGEVNKKGLHTKKKVIVVLERASLETVKTKKGFELVCSDTHAGILKRYKKDPKLYRPDIVHQSLLTLLDSPLNKTGHLQVFIHTDRNVLIEVSPHMRIPRTYRRFAGLIVQLLHKLKIRASDGPEVLMKVVKNPVTNHFPPNSLKFALSKEGTMTDMNQFVHTLPNDQPVVFMCGSHAHGPAEVAWSEKTLAISSYPLSASFALGRVCGAFESLWGIL